MVPFGTSFIAIALAFALPALVSLWAVRSAAAFVNARYLAAFALGVYLWFFSDTIGDSAYLGVNSGFGGGAEQAGLLILFVAGLALMFALDRKAFQSGSASEGRGIWIPIFVAVAVGVHGLGEGAAFSNVAASTPAQDLLSAFGGLSSAVAFVLHKFLEPAMVGAAWVAYARDRPKVPGEVARDLLLLTLVFILPGLLGAGTGYWLSYDTTYVFALGLGTSVYAAVRLAKPLFGRSEGKWESTRIAAAIGLGFLGMYLAALFHG